MKISFQFAKNPSSASIKLDEKSKAISEQSFDALVKATVYLHEQVIRGVSKQSQGERQVRYNPRRVVVASRPGDPPNIDTRRFISSIQFEVDKTAREGYVGSNDVRGPWFEFGTKNMRPRPWLRPPFKRSVEKLKDFFRKVGK